MIDGNNLFAFILTNKQGYCLHVGVINMHSVKFLLTQFFKSDVLISTLHQSLQAFDGILFAITWGIS